MRAVDAITLSNASASSALTALSGGRYVLMAQATFGGGSVKVQFQLPGGSLVDVANGSLSANGILAAVELPPGQYQITVTTATAVFAALTRVPGE